MRTLLQALPALHEVVINGCQAPKLPCSGLLQALQGVDLPEEEDDDFDFANEISLPDLPEDDGSLHVPVTRMRAARGDE